MKREAVDAVNQAIFALKAPWLDVDTQAAVLRRALLPLDADKREPLLGHINSNLGTAQTLRDAMHQLRIAPEEFSRTRNDDILKALETAGSRVDNAVHQVRVLIGLALHYEATDDRVAVVRTVAAVLAQDPEAQLAVVENDGILAVELKHTLKQRGDLVFALREGEGLGPALSSLFLSSQRSARLAQAGDHLWLGFNFN